jgi:isoleucyl-tRNA synthetase
VIFANSRLVATSDILKPVHRYGQIKGVHIFTYLYIQQHIDPLLSGSDLVGVSYRPLFSSLCPSAKSMKIIPSSHVTALSGTGLVHCAPAHGQEDYAAFRSLGLLSNATTILCHVDEQGAFSPEIANVVGKEAAASLIGKDVLGAGNAAMLALLTKEQRAVKTEKIRHCYPYDWKTNKPVIVTYDFLFLLRCHFPKFQIPLLTGRRHNGLPIWMVSRKMRSLR